MRLNKIKVLDAPPIQHFAVDGLSDLVVIAGANGAGKTRLISQILNAIQNEGIRNVEFELECTNDEERERLGANLIDSSNPAQRKQFLHFLQRNRQRRNFKSGVIYFESDRTITKVEPLKFLFEYADPFTENIGWNVPMQPFKNRWQDTQHAIFKKILTLRNQLGSQAMNLQREGHDRMEFGFTDPIQPFKEAFYKLLAPKELIQPELQSQRLMYQEGEEKRPVDTLSSGEREVLNIAFDFILRKPSDCIVFFDEPELHLHPELLNRLIKTLQSSGERNQFVLITHSPEVISSSLDETVIFLTKAKPDKSNQATILKPDGETTEALSTLGQSVGVVALGKKVVLIEGRDASLDAKVYGTLAQRHHPDLILVPSESRSDLESFDRLNEGVLKRTLWGVQFFMLADRDCSVAAESESTRFRILPRYHLENYFLDSEILAECFRIQEPGDSWLRQAAQIEARLHAIAMSKRSYAASLIASSAIRQQAGNVSVKPSNVHEMNKPQLLVAARDKAIAEKARLDQALASEHVVAQFDSAYAKVEAKLEDGDTWKTDIPAKQILAQFCSEAHIQAGRLKNLYIELALKQKPEVFEEIFDILESFSEA